MSNLTKKIQNVANSNNLWEKKSKIIVGFSGGPDSVCLLDIMANISIKYGINLHLAHVNYGLRGQDSNKDQKLVQNLSEKYGLGLSILKPGKFKKSEISEEKLRNIRYAFFEKLRMELDFDYIAVAHNKDDQVETFLMRIIRGAGFQGLSGMKYKSGNIIRPLLGISRKEILEYIKEKKIKYRTDKTNAKNLFFRNKVRNKLIPYLEKEFNPNLKETIFKETLNINDDLSLISELVERNINKIGIINVGDFLNLHPSLQKRLILAEIENIKGNLKNITSGQVEEILKIAKSNKNKGQIFMFQGLKLVRKGDRLNLIKLTNKN